jgi:hypothetical protein
MTRSVIPAKAGTQEYRLADPAISMFMGPGLRRDDAL